MLTIVISVVTLAFQVQDPNFLKGVVWIVLWLAAGSVYFVLMAQRQLVFGAEDRAAQVG